MIIDLFDLLDFISEKSPEIGFIMMNEKLKSNIIKGVNGFAVGLVLWTLYQTSQVPKLPKKKSK